MSGAHTPIHLLNNRGNKSESPEGIVVKVASTGERNRIVSSSASNKYREGAQASASASRTVAGTSFLTRSLDEGRRGPAPCADKNVSTYGNHVRLSDLELGSADRRSESPESLDDLISSYNAKVETRVANAPARSHTGTSHTLPNANQPRPNKRKSDGLERRHTASAKKLRPGQACNRCRIRKTRCNGGTPCKACIDVGAKCTRDPPEASMDAGAQSDGAASTPTFARFNIPQAGTSEQAPTHTMSHRVVDIVRNVISANHELPRHRRPGEDEESDGQSASAAAPRIEAATQPPPSPTKRTLGQAMAASKETSPGPANDNNTLPAPASSQESDKPEIAPVTAASKPNGEDKASPPASPIPSKTSFPANLKPFEKLLEAAGIDSLRTLKQEITQDVLKRYVEDLAEAFPVELPNFTKKFKLRIALEEALQG